MILHIVVTKKLTGFINFLKVVGFCMHHKF
jgi:hypothetical protein